MNSVIVFFSAFTVFGLGAIFLGVRIYLDFKRERISKKSLSIGEMKMQIGSTDTDFSEKVSIRIKDLVEFGTKNKYSLTVKDGAVQIKSAGPSK